MSVLLFLIICVGDWVGEVLLKRNEIIMGSVIFLFILKRRGSLLVLGCYVVLGVFIS